MATKTSKTAETFPEDRLTELLAELDEALQAESDAETAFKELCAQLERIQLYPARARRLELEYAIARHVGRSRRRFFPKGKMAKRRTGHVQRKFNPPSVGFPVTADATLKLVLERELYQFVRWVPAKAELNLEAMHARPDEAKALLGIHFVQDEELRVKVPSKRQSYVLRGRRILEQLRLYR